MDAGFHQADALHKDTMEGQALHRVQGQQGSWHACQAVAFGVAPAMVRPTMQVVDAAEAAFKQTPTAAPVGSPAVSP